jgi:hypothetical protein
LNAHAFRGFCVVLGPDASGSGLETVVASSDRSQRYRRYETDDEDGRFKTRWARKWKMNKNESHEIADNKSWRAEEGRQKRLWLSSPPPKSHYQPQAGLKGIQIPDTGEPPMKPNTVFGFPYV